MRVSTVCAGFLLVGSVVLTGCPSADNKPVSTPTPGMTGGTNGTVTTMPTLAPTTTAATLPTTITVTVPNAVVPEVILPATVPATEPAVVVTPPKSTFAATHVLIKDEPYYKEVPAAPSAPADGTLNSGTKVLVFSFSGAYAKVSTEEGASVYIATEGIDPISKK